MEKRADPETGSHLAHEARDGSHKGAIFIANSLKIEVDDGYLMAVIAFSAHLQPGRRRPGFFVREGGRRD